MSIVNRAQFLESVTHSFPTATPVQTFDVPRPQTEPAQVAYAEGTDYVTKPTHVDEDYAGEVVISLPAALQLATVLLQVVEIRKLLPTAQKGLSSPSSSFPHPPGVSGALFPSGAPTDSEHVRFQVQENATPTSGIPLNGDVALSYLGMEVGGSPGRSYPGITLRAGEYVRLTIANNSGGDLLNQQIEAHYRMGQHQTDVGRP